MNELNDDNYLDMVKDTIDNLTHVMNQEDEPSAELVADLQIYKDNLGALLDEWESMYDE